MCGIVGFIGKEDALSFILKGLKALEYRGYDSAGLAISNGRTVKLVKTKGQVQELENLVADQKISGWVGLGHTRWATHGLPSRRNAHPHHDCNKEIFIVHNGIIENYKSLRNHLSTKGHQFYSDTDSEIIAHLIEDFLTTESNVSDAVFKTLKTLEGAYALVVLTKQEPNKIYAARLSSPLVIGLGEDKNILASDPAGVVGVTRRVIYLPEGSVAEISADEVKISNFNRQPAPLDVQELEWNLEQAQKGNFPHFMFKEIFEAPQAVEMSYRGRLKLKEKLIKLGGLESVAKELRKVKRIIILASGTSYHAGLIGEYYFEELAGVPTEVQIASEFNYRQEPFDSHTVVLAISQSGETADTLAAVKKAKKHQLLTLGIVNVVGSSIARETDAGVYNHAGPEIGVASTKAFISQMTILLLIAFYLKSLKSKITAADWRLLKELTKIPEKIGLILDKASLVEKLADRYKNYHNFLFLGRRYHHPLAKEGALKLKEISYIHAEGYGGGEMKHGPIAMIDENFPTIALVPQNDVVEKMYSNIEEIKSRKGPVVAIASEGDSQISNLTKDVFCIPAVPEPLQPFLTVVPLQLFAYFVGVKLGFNVDKPRNLAKSVTVE